MPRTHIRWLVFRTCFPPNDSVATHIARLCILREDFMLELYGINGAKISELDGNSEACRRLYFWRNSLRTLEIICQTLNDLNGLCEFRAWLALKTPENRAAFEETKKQLNKARDIFLYELRCTITAHLDREAMQETLNTIEWGRGGLIEVGDFTKDIHYKFTGELLLSMLLLGVPEHALLVKLEEVLKWTAELIPSLNIMDEVISQYLKERVPV